jgi:hypothetical protein
MGGRGSPHCLASQAAPAVRGVGVADRVRQSEWPRSMRLARAGRPDHRGIRLPAVPVVVLTSRSGTQRARGLRSRTTISTSAPWSSSPPSDLRITRVFPCVARGFKARPSFMFAGCCWWRSLAVEGSSGAPRGMGSQCVGHVVCGAAPSYDRLLFRPDVSPGRHRKCECLRALATADVFRWLLLLLSPLVGLRAQSRLMLEGRARTLSGPSPDLTSSVSGLFQDQRQVLQPRSAGLWACPAVTVTVFGRPPDRARGGHELLMVRLRASAAPMMLLPPRSSTAFLITHGRCPGPLRTSYAPASASRSAES